MRRIIVGVFTLIALGSAGNLRADSPVKFEAAALLPLTGPQIEQGTWIKQGLDMAVDDLAKEGIAVNLKFDDTQGDPPKAVSAFQSLQRTGLPSVMFTFGSGVGLTLSPMTNKEKVLQMGVATGTDKYTSPEDYTFRIYNAASADAKYAAELLSSQFKNKSVAYVWMENEACVSYVDAVRKQVSSSGVNEVYADSFLPGTTDFRSQLLKLKAKHPDLIVLLSYPVEGNLLLKQIREAGISQKILTFGPIINGTPFQDVATAMGDQLTVVFPVPVNPEANKTQYDAFIKAYQSRFKTDLHFLNFFANRAYAALMIIGHTAKQCGVAADKTELSTCLKDKLLGAQNISSSFGSISFDRNGDVTTAFKLLSWSGNGFKLRDSF